MKADSMGLRSVAQKADLKAENWAGWKGQQMVAGKVEQRAGHLESLKAVTKAVMKAGSMAVRSVGLTVEHLVGCLAVMKALQWVAMTVA